MPGRIHSPAHFLVRENDTSAHGRLRRAFPAGSLRFRGLIAVQEVELDAVYFDQIAVVQPRKAGDGLTIDLAHALGAAEVVAILSLGDLRCDLRGEPFVPALGGDLRFAGYA